LVLISRRLRDLIFVVIGFTIGHSLTLTLTLTLTLAVTGNGLPPCRIHRRAGRPDHRSDRDGECGDGLAPPGNASDL